MKNWSDYYNTWKLESSVTELLGKTVVKLEILGEDEALRFYCSDNSVYMMLHNQACCEDVYLEDISGDLNFLLDSPILMAEEVTEEREWTEEDMTSHTWTFYKFATKKGYVTLRWLGSSNGYYSESVSFLKLTEH